MALMVRGGGEISPPGAGCCSAPETQVGAKVRERIRKRIKTNEKTRTECDDLMVEWDLPQG